MRAVARGFSLESLPLCPDACGGKGINPAQVTEAVRRHRRRFGCDAPIPEGQPCHYAIRCPRCDGRARVGQPCDRCGSGPTPGFLQMRRCPASYVDPDVEAFMFGIRYVADGFLPHTGSMGDQTLSFTEARAIFERERDEAVEEQRKENPKG